MNRKRVILLTFGLALVIVGFAPIAEADCQEVVTQSKVCRCTGLSVFVDTCQGINAPDNCCPAFFHTFCGPTCGFFEAQSTGSCGHECVLAKSLPSTDPFESKAIYARLYTRTCSGDYQLVLAWVREDNR